MTSRYEAESRSRHEANKARLKFWNAAALVVADPKDAAKMQDLRDVVQEQGEAVARIRESITWYEAAAARQVASAATAAERSATRLATVAETQGDRCQASVSDRDSRWPRWNQCQNKAKGRVVLDGPAPADLCGLHIGQWAKGRSVWMHRGDR
jgi:hypothetical protein